MRSARLAVVLAALVMISACAARSTPGLTGPAPTATAQPPTPATSGGPTAPEILRFTASTVDGKPFDAAALAGKPVVLWFWAAWCSHCKADAGNVRALQQELLGQVHMVGVAGLGSTDEGMRQFVATYQLSGFPNLADDAGAVWTRFEVPSQHYYIVVDSAGTIAHRGPMTIDQLRQKLAGVN